MDRAKENYGKRLLHCMAKKSSDVKNAHYWQMAIEVYAHLIDCNLSHTAKYDGKQKCDWFGQ